jgi:hypothetical protein
VVGKNISLFMNDPVLVDFLLSLLKKPVENQKNENMNKYNKEKLIFIYFIYNQEKINKFKY